MPDSASLQQCALSRPRVPEGPSVSPEALGTLKELAKRAWKAFEHTGSHRVEPSFPILFFGDLEAYWASNPRVLTVGLNPSDKEFPPESPFRRFPKASEITREKDGKYLDSLSEYFATHPYRWFRSYELVLNGLDSSFCPGNRRTALHTDIGSPVATRPTWRRIDKASRREFENEGRALWHDLIVALRAEVVLLSLAKEHLARIEFDSRMDWKEICRFDRTKDDRLRKHPIEITARWYRVGDRPALFVHGPAAQTPFGRLSSDQKREAGRAALQTWRRGAGS